METYTFVQIKSKLDDKKSWLFKPKDIDQIIEHWYKYPASVIREGTHHMVRKVLNGLNLDELAKVWKITKDRRL